VYPSAAVRYAFQHITWLGAVLSLVHVTANIYQGEHNAQPGAVTKASSIAAEGQASNESTHYVVVVVVVKATRCMHNHSRLAHLSLACSVCTHLHGNTTQNQRHQPACTTAATHDVATTGCAPYSSGTCQMRRVPNETQCTASCCNESITHSCRRASFQHSIKNELQDACWTARQLHIPLTFAHSAPNGPSRHSQSLTPPNSMQ
jgi:hypothetical protein